MRKNLKVIVGATIGAVIIGAVCVICAFCAFLGARPGRDAPEVFRLSEEFYVAEGGSGAGGADGSGGPSDGGGSRGEIVPTEIAKVEKLRDEGASFLVFVSQPNCRSAESFRGVIKELLADAPLRILEVDFSELKESEIAPEVKFYPSFVIFHNGEVADFLDANSDEDTAAYTSLTGLKEWLEKYIEMGA